MLIDLENELGAIHRNCLAIERHDYITKVSKGALAGLILMGLENKSKETRLAVLNLLVGPAVYELFNIRTITSTMNLSQPMATLLIDLLLEPNSKPWRLSGYGQELIHRCESKAQERTLA